MENPKSYTQLLAIAITVMQANDLEEVFATEDGQVFYEKNRAELHASTIESKVYSFDNNKVKYAQAKEQQRPKKGKGAKAETTEVEDNSEVGEATPQEEEGEESAEDTTLKTEE